MLYSGIDLHKRTLAIHDILRARLLLVGRTLRCQRSLGALLEKYNVATRARAGW